MANVMNSQKRAAIVRCLVEGNSIRATCRIVGACKEAVTKLLCDVSEASFAFQDRTLRELPCTRIQADEIWAFIGCKEGHLRPDQKGKGRGDVWTWTALDPDSKLLVSWRCGTRESTDAILFMQDIASRVKGRIQLSTDGYLGYLDAVETAFGADVDHGRVIKIFGTPFEGSRMEARYSPAKCTEVRKEVGRGEPDPAHICTSHNERHNLTMRMQMRRFTRLTNGFSKKFENHAHAVNLHAIHYNFCRIHQSIRCTPAMEAGITDHVWSIEEIIDLLD